MSEAKHIKALERRRDHLRERTRRDPSLTFDIRELRALEYMLNKQTPPRGQKGRSTMQVEVYNEDYFNQNSPDQVISIDTTPIHAHPTDRKNGGGIHIKHGVSTVIIGGREDGSLFVRGLSGNLVVKPVSGNIINIRA